MTTPSPDVLDDLIARLEAAEGADRDLDADLALGLGVLTRVNVLADHPAEEPIWEYLDDKRNTRGRHHPMVRQATASIDAAIALVNRAMPAANRFGVEKATDADWDGFVSRNGVKSGHWLYEATHRLPAISVCIALCRALRQEASHV